MTTPWSLNFYGFRSRSRSHSRVRTKLKFMMTNDLNIKLRQSLREEMCSKMGLSTTTNRNYKFYSYASDDLVTSVAADREVYDPFKRHTDTEKRGIPDKLYNGLFSTFYYGSGQANRYLWGLLQGLYLLGYRRGNKNFATEVTNSLATTGISMSGVRIAHSLATGESIVVNLWQPVSISKCEAKTYEHIWIRHSTGIPLNDEEGGESVDLNKARQYLEPEFNFFQMGIHVENFINHYREAKSDGDMKKLLVVYNLDSLKWEFGLSSVDRERYSFVGPIAECGGSRQDWRQIYLAAPGSEERTNANQLKGIWNECLAVNLISMIVF